MEALKKMRYDIILIIVLLIVSVSALLLMNAFKTEGAYVVVSVNGTEVNRYALDQEGGYSLNGGTNILVIKGGVAYLKDANCPDKLCVNQGSVHFTGQTITCLPNKLTVSVVGKAGDVDLES
jgi:hypothetical protein